MVKEKNNYPTTSNFEKTNKISSVMLKVLFLPILFFCSNFLLNGQVKEQNKIESEKVLRSIADGILKDAAFEFVDLTTGKKYNDRSKVPYNAKIKPESPYTDWRYWNGVLNIAMLEVGNVLNESAYAEFPSRNMDFAFNSIEYFEERYNGEGKWNYPFGQFFITEELDDCGAMGASLIEIYKSDRQKRYLDYINKAVHHILTLQGRLEDGTLVRSFPNKWTLWADDLYMSISFLSRMGEMTGDEKYFNDAVNQVIKFHYYLFNEDKGLMSHCWYSDLKQNGVAFWGRANGWALLAQADLLDRLPVAHKDRETLKLLFVKHIIGLSRYQSKEGLWNQLLDKSDSFLETSCSAMFTYAIARGINKGYLDRRFRSIAEKGWEGILKKINSEGKIQGVCTGTGVSDNIVFYYERPTPLHDVHGIGAVILAGSEVLQLSNSK